MPSGYEIFGLDNIPSKGPALIISFHGTMPFDMYYLAAKVFLLNKRVLISVVDKGIFEVTGDRLLINHRENCRNASTVLV